MIILLLSTHEEPFTIGIKPWKIVHHIQHIIHFLFGKCSNMNIIWVLWIFETIGAHRWWCILFIYVPCCQTIMMSLVVIVCYQEKCRKTKTRQYFSWIWLWLLCTVAMETKNTTMVTYFESPRSIVCPPSLDEISSQTLKLIVEI